MDDESKNIVVVVEDVEASKTALQWALHNLLRYGDVLTLLHVFPSPMPRSAAAGKKKKKQLRGLRLKGYHLALSFKELCSNFFNTRIEIVVAEDDDRQEGGRILALVREIGAFALVVGLHDHSFLYKLGMSENNLARAFNCRVLAVKHPSSVVQAGGSSNPSRQPSSVSSLPTGVAAALLSSPNVAFSQIDVSTLQIPEYQPQKIPYRICPSPYAIIWRRSRKTRRRRLGMSENNLARAFNCRVLAVKHPSSVVQAGGSSNPSRQPSSVSSLPTGVAAALLSSPNVAFSQIDVSTLQIPEYQPQKIPYRICPSPYAIIWRRSRKTRRRRHAP